MGEAGQQGHAARHIGPVAEHVDAREGHVARADEKGHQVVAECPHPKRDDAQEHHDGPVHRAKLVVEFREHDALGHSLRSKDPSQPGKCLPGISELPAHEQHEEKPDEQKGQGSHGILDADDLMIGGEYPAGQSGVGHEEG